MKNLTVVIDWKFIAALGTSVVAAIFACKMDGSAGERVFIHGIDACKGNNNHKCD